MRGPTPHTRAPARAADQRGPPESWPSSSSVDEADLDPYSSPPPSARWRRSSPGCPTGSSEPWTVDAMAEAVRTRPDAVHPLLPAGRQRDPDGLPDRSAGRPRADLLLTTDLIGPDIAYACGFGSEPVLRHRLPRHYGRTPERGAAPRPMRTPARTTVLLALLLGLLLAVAYAVVSSVGQPAEPRPEPSAPSSSAPKPFPTVGTPTPPPDTPRSGAGYPVRSVGRLVEDRSVLVNGRGNADLRYRRAPGNGTRLHFICTGCGPDTWLVEQPRGNPVGGEPSPTRPTSRGPSTRWPWATRPACSSRHPRGPAGR